MIVLVNVTLDTQRVGLLELNSLLEGGQILHAAGVINIRWDDFSASEAVQDAGLTGVEWERVMDDTPGILELTLLYSQKEREEIGYQMAQTDGVDSYEIFTHAYSDTEI